MTFELIEHIWANTSGVPRMLVGSIYVTFKDWGIGPRIVKESSKEVSRWDYSLQILFIMLHVQYIKHNASKIANDEREDNIDGDE